MSSLPSPQPLEKLPSLKSENFSTSLPPTQVLFLVAHPQKQNRIPRCVPRELNVNPDRHSRNNVKAAKKRFIAPSPRPCKLSPVGYRFSNHAPSSHPAALHLPSAVALPADTSLPLRSRRCLQTRCLRELLSSSAAIKPIDGGDEVLEEAVKVVHIGRAQRPLRAPTRSAIDRPKMPPPRISRPPALRERIIFMPESKLPKQEATHRRKRRASFGGHFKFERSRRLSKICEGEKADRRSG